MCRNRNNQCHITVSIWFGVCSDAITMYLKTTLFLSNIYNSNIDTDSPFNYTIELTSLVKLQPPFPLLPIPPTKPLSWVTEIMVMTVTRILSWRSYIFYCHKVFVIKLIIFVDEHLEQTIYIECLKVADKY